MTCFRECVHKNAISKTHARFWFKISLARCRREKFDSILGRVDTKNDFCIITRNNDLHFSHLKDREVRLVLGRMITKTPFQKHTLVFGFKIWFQEFCSTAGTTLARYRREKQDSVLRRVMTKLDFCSITRKNSSHFSRLREQQMRFV